MNVLDSREIALSEELDKLGVEYDIKLIEIGDYIIKGIICVERKGWLDFLDSIKDGRLYTQLRNMMKYKERVIIIEHDGIIFNETNFNEHALIAEIGSAIAKYGCTIIQTANTAQTAYMLKCLSEKYGEEIEDLPLQTLKPKDLENGEDLYKYQVFFMSGLPSFGSETTQLALDIFGTPEAFFNAVKSSSILLSKSGKAKAVIGDIKKMKGISWKTLFKLKKVLTEKGIKCKQLRLT